MPDQDPREPERLPGDDPTPGGTVEAVEAGTTGLAVFGWLFLALQLVAVYLPGNPVVVPAATNLDKLVHAALFALPVYFFGRLTRRVGLIAGVFAVHAVASELIQGTFLPNREGDVWDVVADLVGIVLAVLLVHIQQPRR